MIAVNIPSFSNPELTHLVRLTTEGWKCDCPNFVFNEKRIVKCKHIEEAYKKIEEQMVH